MKNAIRFLSCVLLAFLLIFPVFSVAASGQDLRYGSGTADQTLFADELFDLLFADEEALTDFERSWLRSQETLALSYSGADLPATLVSWNYDGNAGTLTITAAAFPYTARNGEEVVWVPQTVCISGVSHPLKQSENSYTYTASGIWNSGSTEFTVEYAWTVDLSAATADAILTGAYPAAKEIRDRLDAYAIDHAEWETQTALYEAFCAARDAYPQKYAAWETKKQNYDAYLAAKADYDARVAEYQEICAEWEAYQAYCAALNDYKAAVDSYPAYAQTMAEVESRLAVAVRLVVALRTQTAIDADAQLIVLRGLVLPCGIDVGLVVGHTVGGDAVHHVLV